LPMSVFGKARSRNSPTRRLQAAEFRWIGVICTLLGQLAFLGMAQDVKTYWINVSPRIDPVSLEHLSAAAKVVVEGSVQRALPSMRLPTPGRVPFIETHFVFAVDSVIKGDSGKQLLVAQTGGTIDSVELKVSGDTPLQVGDHYLLFLEPDTRPLPLNQSDLPRFSIIGVWAGKVSIRNGRVRFPDYASPGLRALNDTDRLGLVKKVQGAGAPSFRDKTLPMHPTPKRK